MPSHPACPLTTHILQHVAGLRARPFWLLDFQGKKSSSERLVHAPWGCRSSWRGAGTALGSRGWAGASDRGASSGRDRERP